MPSPRPARDRSFILPESATTLYLHEYHPHDDAWLFGGTCAATFDFTKIQAHCGNEIFDGEQAYGLSWFSSKVNQWDTKWIPDIMESVARRAIKNLKELTQEGRKMAKWYEDNPGRLYLPPHLAHLRKKQYITSNELLLLLGGRVLSMAWSWASTKHKLQPIVAET